MKTLLYILLFLNCVSFVSAQEKETIVRITTNKGVMRVKLYNDTPIHRDFFLSQIKKGYYDGSLFGRVLPNFVIQGGSEDSKGAPPGQLVGHGRGGKMLVAPEIRPNHYPIRGVIAMPRQPDDINPSKKSDGSQFFIIQGRRFTDDELNSLELQKNLPTKKKAMAKYYHPYKKEMDSLKVHDIPEYNRRVIEINAKVDSVIRLQKDHLLFDKEEREAYKTVGGAPHIRGQYTIFGEVIEGFDVIDKIADMEADRNNRPLEDVVMSIKIEQ